MALDFIPFFLAKELRIDGSNFAEWYQRLRDTLETNNFLFMIDER